MKLQPIGANQTVLRFDDKAILFSYETPVACIMYNEEISWSAPHQAYRTDKQWSKTTTKHINQWLKYYDEVNLKPQSFFDNLTGE
jgi:hypothetical protein